MLKKTIIKFLIPIIILSSYIPVSLNAAEVTNEQIKGLDEQVQDIKKDVLELTSELTRLEEKLLFPSNTQVSLFVYLIDDKGFVLDSMQIKLDNKIVSQHLYTYKELEALRAGGVQRIYTGNIQGGNHKLDVSVIGKKGGSKTKRNISYTINKGVGPKLVEINLGSGDSAIKIVDQ